MHITANQTTFLEVRPRRISTALGGHGSGRYSTGSPAAAPVGARTAKPLACARPRSIAEPQDGRTAACPSPTRSTGISRCPSPGLAGSAVANVAVRVAVTPCPCSTSSIGRTNVSIATQAASGLPGSPTSQRPPGSVASSMGCPGFTSTPSTMTSPPTSATAARTWSRSPTLVPPVVITRSASLWASPATRSGRESGSRVIDGAAVPNAASQADPCGQDLHTRQPSHSD